MEDSVVLDPYTGHADISRWQSSVSLQLLVLLLSLGSINQVMAVAQIGLQHGHP